MSSLPNFFRTEGDRKVPTRPRLFPRLYYDYDVILIYSPSTVTRLV